MQLVDANVLLHAINVDVAEHEAARRFLERALRGGRSVGFAWVVLLAFIRVGTSTSFPAPLTVQKATEFVGSWLAANAVVVHPTSRHLDLLRGLLLESGTAGNLASDAHLAALALEHGAEVVTFDRDFGRFAGLSWRLPE